MPMGLVKSERDERLWSKAKSQAAKQGHTEDWAYINGIYQRMKGHKKSASLMEPLVKRAGFVFVDRNTLPGRVDKSKFTPELMEEILLSNDEDIFARALRRQDTPKELLIDLSFSPLKRIRSLVSQHPNTPEMSLRRMQELSKKGNDMSKRGSLLDGLFKRAGKVPGVPDTTGPYGRGEGPGKGTKSGLGLVMAKMERGEELTEKEKAILEAARGKIKK